jgi:prolyl-tRNA editing enzyme YbaK/EbsC (Cys-tRNA(Pro) deacylase)
MDEVLKNSSVIRITAELARRGMSGEVKILSDSARTAAQAAEALEISVGQIASSIVFKITDQQPLLVITSGAHRVNTELVAQNLGIDKLHRADAEFVKAASGISIGGVSPIGWAPEDGIEHPIIIIDEALKEFDVLWAAAGHAHAVFPTTYRELLEQTEAKSMSVGE